MVKELKPKLNHANLYNPDEDNPWRIANNRIIETKKKQA